VTTELPGQPTLTASWQALAQLSLGARVVMTPTRITAVFPSWAPLNNAVMLDRPTPRSATASARELAAVYRSAGIKSWALWIPSSATDPRSPDLVSTVDGMVRDTTTVVMTLTLAHDLPPDAHVVRTSIEAAARATDEPIRSDQLDASDHVPNLDGWVLVHDGRAVTGAWSYLHGKDCGVYALGTVPDWRRQGFATRMMHHVLGDVHRRGARSASLQSTLMAQQLYLSLGFIPVGRYEEWVPTPE
jgi:GNAT superfamily N-acetyltransferase